MYIITNSHNERLPVGLITQLVEHSAGTYLANPQRDQNGYFLKGGGGGPLLRVGSPFQAEHKLIASI